MCGTQRRRTRAAVVRISSSSDEADVKKARSLGARDYFVKPHQIEDFVAIVRTLQSRWLTPPVA